MNVSSEVQRWLKGLKTEIGANRTLAPRDDYNRGWNAGSENAMRLIDRYAAGEGLFQCGMDNPTGE